MDGIKMINTIEQFGRNAGRIWEMLDACGPLSESQLMEFTSLRTYEFYVAVGWLARENKIVKDDTLYRLDETNLTFEIGGNAGKIWNALRTQREAGIPYISKLTQMKMSDAYCALGWLAREDKIQIKAVEENNIK
jgi:hypothetical protein